MKRFIILLVLFAVLMQLNDAHEIDEKLDPCASNPCGQFGICYSHENQTQFECQCFGDAYGDRCELEYANACASEPCQNSATCYRIRDSYYCSCPFLYFGTDCENKFEGEFCLIMNLNSSLRFQEFFFCNERQMQSGKSVPKRRNLFPEQPELHLLLRQSILWRQLWTGIWRCLPTLWAVPEWCHLQPIRSELLLRVREQLLRRQLHRHLFDAESVLVAAVSQRCRLHASGRRGVLLRLR